VVAASSAAEAMSSSTIGPNAAALALSPDRWYVCSSTTASFYRASTLSYGAGHCRPVDIGDQPSTNPIR
jgi:hypothetical protein